MKKKNMFFTGFKKGYKGFGHNITIIVNSILLSIVYIIGVGITSLISKITRKHFLDTKLSKNGTYWHDLNLKKKKIDQYYRQF